MAISDFIEKSRARYRSHGIRAAPGIAGEFAAELASRTIPFHRYGRRIFEHRWDVLVILDACRADMYHRLVNEDADVAWSCGGSSFEWMQKTFDSEYRAEMADTAYVTGNPFSEDQFETSSVHSGCEELGLLDEVWRYAWDEELGTIPARPLTDRGISVRRSTDFDRVIVHYMQPHYPFIGSDESWGHLDVENFGAGGAGKNVWHEAMLGEVDVDDVLAAYDANLEYVWDDVELLLENVSGDVVVTADHGNSVGDWGIWGHRPRIPAPSLRRVPWDRYRCEDERTHDPKEYDRDRRPEGETVDDRLKSLGYL